MTERQKLIDKARKVAALMTSPVEAEMIAATIKLKQLLTEHNLSLKELGLSDLINENHKHTTAKHEANKANTNNLKDVVRTSGASREVTSEAIIEVAYKHFITGMDGWLLCVLLKIAHAYEAMIIGDRYGTWAEKSHYLKIIAFPEDIEKVKRAIVNIRHFIETQILIRGYTEKIQVANYAMGLADTITLKITEDTDRRSTYESRILSRSKSLKLSEYLYRCYGLTTDCDHPIDLGRDKDAYRTGLYDGHTFFRQNSCRDALLAALKNRSETAMERVG